MAGTANPRLANALVQFEQRLRHAKPNGRRSKSNSKRLQRVLRWLLPLALTGVTAGTLVASPAFATHGTLAIGATVFNPVTQANETVVEVIGSGYLVRTSANHFIFLATKVGDTYSVTASGVTTAYTVKSVTSTTYGTGTTAVTYVTGVTVESGTGSTVKSQTVAVVSDYVDPTPSTGGGSGSGSAVFNGTIPAGNEQYQDIRVGAHGGNGRTGGGINVCVPLTSWCVFIGWDATDGGNGAPGPDFTSTVPSDYSGGLISSTAANLAGIKIASIGGNGGTGGDSISIGGKGGNGGAAGVGGDVIGNNYGSVLTGGVKSHGMWVFSQAGIAGNGGTGILAAGGGGGGGAAQGGDATGNNYGRLETQGDGAVGLLVQSLGGGGGSGGSSYGIVGLAGSGSVGGNGGDVTAHNAGTILTGGKFAFGVQAQSIGGTGGNSGDSAGLVAFGGTAGGAGTGGNSSISLAGTSDIKTAGDYAHGVFAQSIGGGGGSTGWSGGLVSFGSSAGIGGTGGSSTVTASAGSRIETFGKGAYGIFAESVGGNGGTAGGTGGIFTLGGTGGSGNTGGSVNINQSGQIVTHGIDSRGLFAQSVGGGGGSANASGGLVSLGGSGGSGASGGAVTVTLGSGSAITTYGKGADAAFAQSVGGGGGAGATSSGLVALGGSGSVGGAGGAVSVSNAGSIETVAAYSRGLFAQSVGGGGGSGGDSYGLAAIGGSGSVASDGGTVTVSNSGSIKTGQNMSTAVQAQSIGGGGGDGGTTGGVLLTIGGSGAGGGIGGTVTTNLSGRLETEGNDSHGLFAQSVGGGGGNGGSSTSVSLFVGLALGGNGGAGGAGGQVTANFNKSSVLIAGTPVLVSPLITTEGDRSRGVFLQSVGGGGGSGGMAVQVSAGLFGAASFAIGGSAANGSRGGLVRATGDVTVNTSGDYSEGFFAQSVGGGGGNGGAAVSVAASVGIGASASLSVGIGGKGGGGGDGGIVQIDSGGSILTSGSFSTGFVSQSVGGGGGKGGFSVSVAGAGSDGIAITGALGIGGTGGSGGLGGNVTSVFNGDITTGNTNGSGSDSAGAIIQSVGGGGGIGGFNVSASIGIGGGAALGAAVGLGGSGGSGGVAGTVIGTIGGDVVTRGVRSTGVLIQSAGGGGGSGGFNVSGNIGLSGGIAAGVSVGLGGAGGGGGTGGTVTGTALGQVETFAAQSDGVVIQSVGGGGGSGGFNVSGNINFGGTAGVSIGVGLGGNGGGAGFGGMVTGTVSQDVLTHGNQSRGILVQSVGGGGGAGAFNITGGIAGGGTFGGSLGVGLGGNGGGGGGANIVHAFAKSVTTSGYDSAGFIAQSIGGGGGVGGFNVTGGLGFGGTAAGTIGFGLGGSGGGGGSAMKVTAGLTGIASTSGDRSGAILAQSVGGGGGSGAFNISAGIAGAGTGAGTLNIGLGGSGGTAGHGGDVTLTVNGFALTYGVDSYGIVAQSVGGGGGAGGFNVAGGIAAGGTGAGQIGFGMGGRGGGGGDATVVRLNVNHLATSSDLARIASITFGNSSAGIVAQSLGGGGGNGGFNVTGGVSLGGTGAGGVNVGIGGSGGDGGTAGNVFANIGGFTGTSGNDSVGVLAQSVGGGGGNGAFNISGGLTIGGTGSGMVNVGIGGAGGSGGNAGEVMLKINEQIITPGKALVAAATTGDGSLGVVAQSLGGGGGNGGFNVTGGINIGGSGTGGASIGIGGMGGDGGFALSAKADITGGISTAGRSSTGLLVQSIGGGGGNGGFNVSGTLSIAKNAGTLGVGIGGFGGDGGNAGEARLDFNQRTLDADNTLAGVSTLRNDSAGIIVQSLGGGGGNGGFNVTAGMAFSSGGAGNIGVGVGGFGGGGGDAAIARANVRGDLVTGGDRSGALLVQSLGGGGGNGGFNVTAGLAVSKGANGNIGVGIGGFGGDGGDGKAVFATIESDIRTTGNESYGANIQSLGGGGGNGGFNVTGGVAISLGQAGSGNLGVGIGGFGGSGGNSDEVQATLTGNIQTSGIDSHGVLVQSAGGGGGNGGFNVTGGISVTKGTSGSIGVGVGGFGGDGGLAKKVTASVTGNISTLQDKSYGAMFQSLGGGGGNGAFNVTAGINVSLGPKGAGNLNVGIGGFGGGGGGGGNVIGSMIGNIQTRGNDAFGALMQSVGGGGGNGGFNVSGGIALAKGSTGTVGFGLGGFGGDGGNAGTVDGLLDGNITTRGIGSYAVMFMSLGGAGGTGALNVTGGINISKGDSTSGGASIGIGGFGGGGGNAMRVTAEARGLYQTSGRDSAGAIAQSIGGGGGSGGLNVSGSIGISTQGTAASASLGLGGFGGDGGSSGDVTLTRIGQTATLGRNSDGVVAQSIGGGGGRGALNVSGGITGTNTGDAGSIVIGIGGFGGAGGNAGSVTATIVDSVWAKGADAPIFYFPEDYVLEDGSKQGAGFKGHWAYGSSGIIVQSIGGGGGSGGMNISGGISLAKADKDSTASALVLGIGGFGGSGGDAGLVNATIGKASGPRIQVQSQGDNKSAVYIASIGGGGGDGGMNISGAITTSGNVVAGFGGAGSGGGLGKDVVARVDADLFAEGYQASGLTVQSLGGGGGNGGINISGGLKATARTEPVIVFGMGGDGGAGNSSGAVTVQQDGQVFVNGYSSHGILVQSIAGGGGSGGFDVVAVLNRSDGKSQFDGFAAGIGIGGTGGRGSVAGDVYLRSTGDVLVNSKLNDSSSGPQLIASGEDGLSAGITVQSIGGGGGVGGFNFTGVVAPKGNPLTIAVGGSGGVGGDAGNVTVVRGYREDGTISRSLINIFGYHSAGLVAQSIGGGGGNAGTNLAFAMGSTEANKTGFGGQFIIGGDGQSSGNGKNVTVTHAGFIQTSGSGSDGILAQSIGKGGGNAAINIGFTKLSQNSGPGSTSGSSGSVNGFSLALGGAAGDAGSAGNVTVNHDGVIFVNEMLSSGIVAQSLAGGGGNTALNMGVLLGADNVVKVGIGRLGGKGGTSGDVVVNATGLIKAAGEQSNGIVAQSIGGAGGLSGTMSVEGQLKSGSGKDATKNGVAVSVGLEGGAGGRSGLVTVANDADISTDGEDARGIIAQSIGGDGGVAGSARTLTTGQADSVAVAIGGGGGSGAISSKVTVGNSGVIVTEGNTSDGILAQSIGGGGGVAGSATTIKNSVDGLDQKSAVTIAVAVGGSGGDGAIGGDVEVTNDGTIVTLGNTSFGIRAQSIGGGGGVGGASYNVERQKAKDPSTLNILVGGGGGDGQAAGRVDVINHGVIMTSGSGASAISANSIGGGGGDAGSVANLTYVTATAGGKSNALQLAIGGGGGSGGTGGTVHIVNAPNATEDSGTIVTSGSDAHGIFAQSLGGGGGNGSSILSIYKSDGANDSISIGLNIGGAGGTGNTGGEVTVENSGIIRTKGDNSIGILAQSIGGGGGNGGVVLSANILWKSKDKSPLVSIGGIGGAGNDGGHVTVINSGRIITEGKNADGIVAQSIGGGGGNAGLGVALTGDLKTLVGSNLMSLLVGAVGGGTAGVGGQVDVTHSGDITVLGEGSQAIVAESINGGGGSVHFDLSGITVPSVSAAVPGLVIPDLGELNGFPSLVAGEPVNAPVAPVIVAARAGASDATSMNAGKVNISISGTMGAGGDYGSGSTIRSVGGGGGAIGLIGTLVMPEPIPDAGSIRTQSVPLLSQFIYAVALGAKNTNDSSGAAITSSHDGTILTTGKAATGVLLQSIGGGGGSALINLKTENASLIDSVRFGLGAVGTSNSTGGDVSRTQKGSIVTTKEMSHGALIQSIGGGGGSAIANVTVIAPRVVVPTVAGAQRSAGWRDAAVSQDAVPAGMVPAIVILGANGGSGNDGGAVDLDFTGGFLTAGDRATALVVQSIGGGGGHVTLDGVRASSITLGGQSGASGSGGNVTVANDGDVITFGQGANGILIQSIGGGGGILFGSDADTVLTLSSNNSGNGGAVRLTQDGDIAALGGSAYGLIAQSIGGGGGLIDGRFAGTAGGVGRGGLIDLTIDGQVYTPGAGSTAIAAQSLGSLGGGNIGITIAGSVRGGSGTGVGVALDGGTDNVVTVKSNLSAVSGRAMTGTFGNDRLENRGLTVGNILLGGGNNVVHTAAGATFVTIDTLDLRDGAGSTGLFDNDGSLLLGLSADRYPIDLRNGDTFAAPVIADPNTDLRVGTSIISKVALDGNFRQSASGQMYYDVAFGPYQSDRIDATGTAVVDGTANITLTWLENNRDVTLISTGAGGTDNGLDPIDTIAIDYGIRANASGIHLTLATDFGQDFLNYNEREIGRNLDSSVTTGGAAGIGRLLALIGNLTAGQEDIYADIFAELDPETLLAPTVVQLDSARSFGADVTGCATPDERGAKCVFARVDGHDLKRSGGEMEFVSETSVRLRLGGAVSIGDGLQIGAAIGFDDLGDIDADNGRTAGTNGTGFHAGLGIGKRFADNRGEATFALVAGDQSFKTTRFQNIFEPGFGTTKIRTDYWGAHATLGYTLTDDQFFATPSIAVGAIRMNIGDFFEQGLDGTGARSKGSSDWYLSATPKLTAGINDGMMKLSGSVGVQLSSRGAIHTPISLVGAPDRARPADIRTLIDDQMLLLGLNAEVKAGRRATVQVGYEGLYGDRVKSESFNAKLILRF